MPVGVQHHIEDIIADRHLHETEYDLLYVVENHERGTDDDEITEQQDPTDRDVLVFVDHRADDIGTARASVGREYQSQTRSAQETTDDNRHERLVVQ